MADTTEARSTPAQASVFATVELLELVLLNLDPITLFSIQRVCKQWKYLIADSHRLQERMFLRAPVCNNKPKTEIQPSTSCPTTTILPNHSAWDHYKHDNLKYNDTNENENDTEDVDASSILLSPILQPNTLTFPTRNKLAVTCDQTALLSDHHPSWHNMYLSFPACKSTTVALWWTLGDSMRGSVYLESLAGGDGLKFKDVVEAAVATRTGKWKRLPVGEVLPLSAAGKDVSLGDFLEMVVREEGAGEEVEATSMFVMSF
jgi:hypothetical protein